MNKELDAALCSKYPLLFKDRHGDMRETLMCWGFACDDGWYPLIDALCSSLMWDGHNFENNHIRVDPPIVVQVKEKFGTLRFYVDNATKEDRIKIDFAEFLSGTICESCGATRDVSRTKGGWVKTRCLTCQREAGDIEYGN